MNCAVGCVAVMGLHVRVLRCFQVCVWRDFELTQRLVLSAVGSAPASIAVIDNNIAIGVIPLLCVCVSVCLCACVSACVSAGVSLCVRNLTPFLPPPLILPMQVAC